MINTIIDAGPLIALFDKSDQYHLSTLNFMKSFKGKLCATWPVITEVSYFLNFNVKAQIAFYNWVHLGGLYLFYLEKKHLLRISELSEKYINVPMDLADASLIILAEELNISEIISIDSDFDIYRTLKKEYVKNIFKPI